MAIKIEDIDFKRTSAN